jgi:prepilin-type processing-associated H-X9-DG protein/prepilin-type N-terminal cleavage/methylation domain-containing protein
MKRREELGRRPGDGSSRVQSDTAYFRAGFSLIELVCVAAILIILTTLYWGPSSGDRQRALKAACQKNLLSINVALQIYANEQANRFPFVPGARNAEEALEPLVPRYTADTSTFICPGSKDSPPAPGAPLRKSKISYAYYMGRALANSPQVLMSDAQVDSQPKITGQQVFSSTGKPPGSNHGKSGGNFLFTDGHAESSPAHAPFPLNLDSSEALLNP